MADAEARMGRMVNEARESLARVEATLKAERTQAAEAARVGAERTADLQSRIFALEDGLKAASSELTALRERETKVTTELAKEREAFNERIAVYRRPSLG